MATTYLSSLEHLSAEMACINLLLQVELAKLLTTQNSNSHLPGLNLVKEDIARLLNQPNRSAIWNNTETAITEETLPVKLAKVEQDIQQRCVAANKQGIFLRLQALITLFQLSRLDTILLLIALAPELDHYYQQFYGYLQNNLNKKLACVDFALNLLCLLKSEAYSAKLTLRSRLLPEAPLFHYGLLQPLEEPNQPLLSKTLKVEERIVNYLLENDEITQELKVYAKLVSPKIKLNELQLSDEFRQKLTGIFQLDAFKQQKLIFYLQGTEGAGKKTIAESICQRSGIWLLIIDTVQLAKLEWQQFIKYLTLIQREALLQQAAIYWDKIDALLENNNAIYLNLIMQKMTQFNGLAFLAATKNWELSNAFHNITFLHIQIPFPDANQRQQLWQQLQEKSGLNFAEDMDWNFVTNAYRITGGQMRDILAAVNNQNLWDNPASNQITFDELRQACNLLSNRRLNSQAQKIIPHYNWDDIVLPERLKEQLREICNRVKSYRKVYEEWGFGKKLSRSKGLIILFTGLPGTGKTMGAEVIASNLGLELYKIDLSNVISKYIGETEKNLSRIFTEAEAANAILFFDEADAIFGKRTKVTDAHDRHANVEVSYLIQRIEEYTGIVILASNLKANIDEAFMRRLHFCVDFCLPTVAERIQIWQTIWPKDAPLNPNVNLKKLGTDLELTGANIRNIVLAAAFLAAEEKDTQQISMQHLAQAIQREFQNIGKMFNKESFLAGFGVN